MNNTARIRALWLMGIGFIAVLAVVMILSMDSSAEFEGGTGTAGDPYQIANVEQLQDMKLYLDAHYILVDDIDASGTVNWNEGAGFEAVGTPYNNGFIGGFDGNGYTITGLYINKPSSSYVGLFGYVYGSDIEIVNTAMEGLDVSGQSSVGGLIGRFVGGQISNSYVTGSVSGSNQVGGLVG